MQHSIAARYAAWPARFSHPSARARERRLGLRPGTAFVAAPARRTVLRRPDVGPLTALRTPWRSLTVAPARPLRSGRPRHAAAMSWTSTHRAGGPHRSSVAPAWPA
ncbi:MAG TPA: hypothetical protein VIK13_03710 [Candidatus Limnocylindrales bacterium]